MKTLHDAAQAAWKAALLVGLAGAVGLLSLPNYDGVGARALGVAAAIIAAALAALQTFVPALSVRRWVEEPWGSALDSGVHVGVALFLTMVVGFLNAADFSAWHSFVTALATAVAAAFLRAVQGAIFGQHPEPVPVQARADKRSGRAGASRVEPVLLPSA